jgi:hypothetical protein
MNETFLSPCKVERKALVFGLSEGSVTAVGVPGRVRDLEGECPVMPSKAFFACAVREHVSLLRMLYDTPSTDVDRI